MSSYTSVAPEPFRIKMVEPIRLIDRDQREKALADAGLNIFNLNSEDVFIDLLTDSGTGAMSETQWAGIMTGDESYAGSPSFHHLRQSVEDVMGLPYVLPTHQGRAAENVLHSALIKQGDVIPGNSHFDTTKAHIEFRKAKAVDCTIDECFNPETDHPFKGNVDLDKLKRVVDEYGVDAIPFVLITITNNSGGGQPVSLGNIKEVSEFCRSRNLRLFIDAARFAENAWFIKNREEEYKDKSIGEIVRETFSYCDVATMSAKKMPSSISGIHCHTSRGNLPGMHEVQHPFEGFLTYGGLSGRDMEAIAIGLKEGWTRLTSLTGSARYIVSVKPCTRKVFRLSARQVVMPSMLMQNASCLISTKRSSLHRRSSANYTWKQVSGLWKSELSLQTGILLQVKTGCRDLSCCV